MYLTELTHCDEWSKRHKAHKGSYAQQLGNPRHRNFLPSQNPPPLGIRPLWLVHAVVSQQVHTVRWGNVQVDVLQVQQNAEPQC